MLFDSQGKAAAIEKVRVRKHLPEYPGGWGGGSTIVKRLHSDLPPPNRLPVYFPILNSGVGFPSLGASCCTSTA